MHIMQCHDLYYSELFKFCFARANCLRISIQKKRVYQQIKCLKLKTLVEWLYSFNFDHRFSCRDFHFQANYLLLTSLLFFTTISNAILMIIRFNFTYVFIFVLTIALKETHSFALGRFLYFLFAKWWMFTFQRHTHNL